jgi:hypothetical protein
VSKGLKFSAASHRYWLDGKPVPGVTSIIGVLDKPAIPKWAAAQVATFVAENPASVEAMRPLGTDAMVKALKETPWKKRDDAATRGSTFHDFAERILLGEEVDVPDEQVGMVESALSFLDAWKVEPVLVEQAVASREHRYAGTVDLVADVTGMDGQRHRAILDWKSGKRIYPGAVWQLNAYAGAEFYGLGGDEKPVAALGIEQAYGIHIRADGYDVYPLKFGPDTFAEWLMIRQTYDINKRAEGNWRQPGSGYVGRAIQFGDHDE